jgi:hypothetical protein
MAIGSDAIGGISSPTRETPMKALPLSFATVSQFVEQLCHIKMLEEIDTSIKEDVGNVVEVLKEAVCNAIDKKVNADSGINSSILNERLKNLHD